MKVQESKADVLTITGVDGLDPITVFLQDLGPGEGRLTISCYGQSWSAFWGGMGIGRTVRQFLLTTDTTYVLDKLVGGLQRAVSRREKLWALKIVDVVLHAIRAMA